ncbi:LysR family transcriptional regulator [Limnohabitans sp.]|jgi:DNA-binding transcriptional LysR family regulator|uniref:LysR family transcriptional regulator n=1 Tax=Limnohabitans sp. TaxID=1907725 RepID=UPI0037BEBF48
MQVKNKALLGQVSDVDLRLLRVFKAVADCGSLSAAELELNVAVSTISRHIKDLETRLGLVLCRRGRAGFALTPEGEKVYQATDELFNANQVFRSQIHGIQAQLGGDLHVAMFEKCISNPAAQVAQAIAMFQAMAPTVKLHLHVGTIHMIEQGVLDGRYHLGLVPEHRPSEALNYDFLFDEKMFLYVAPGHDWFEGPEPTEAWRDLREQRLAGLDYHSPNMQITHVHRLERSAHASDQEAVAAMVLSGAYVGFLPDHYAKPWMLAKQLKAIAPQVLNYHCRYACILRKHPEPVRVAQAFQMCLLKAHAHAWVR